MKKVKRKFVVKGNPAFGQRRHKAKKGKGSYKRKRMKKSVDY